MKTTREVSGWLEAEAVHYDPEVAVNYLAASRLIAAMGEEVKAWRAQEAMRDADTKKYVRAFNAAQRAKEATDEVTDEFQSPTPERP